jgi:hypothetical protein
MGIGQSVLLPQTPIGAAGGAFGRAHLIGAKTTHDDQTSNALRAVISDVGTNDTRCEMRVLSSLVFWAVGQHAARAELRQEQRRDRRRRARSQAILARSR